MQKSSLDNLLNHKVKSFSEGDNASLGMLFDDGAKISIYNSYRISQVKIDSLVGNKLIKYQDNDESVILSFENIDIFIDLENDAWKGPEAIELILSNGDIIVWN